MLVLSRRRDEAIIIAGNIKVTVVDVRGDKVRLGIEADRDIPVHREEIQRQITIDQTLKDLKQEIEKGQGN